MSRGETVMEALLSAAWVSPGEGATIPDVPRAIHELFRLLSFTFDNIFGGFGKPPKFPQPGMWQM